jgi:hypothetical protein
MRQALGFFLAAVPMGCASPSTDGRHICTVEAVGQEMGADHLDAVLEVPEILLRGAHGGGVRVYFEDCDFPLNAIFSEETDKYIIENAPKDTLNHHDGFFRLVNARLWIQIFSDQSGEAKFFVTSVSEMRPITKARTQLQTEYATEPLNGS